MGIFDKSSSPLSTLFPETSPYKLPDYTNAFNNYTLSVLDNLLFNLGNILKNSSDSLTRLNGNNLINDSLLGQDTSFVDSNRTSQNSSLNKFDWAKGINTLNDVGKSIGGLLGNTLLSISGIGSNIQRVRELNKKMQNLTGDALNNAKLEKAGNISNAVGIGSNLISSFLPQKSEYNGNYGNITLTADLLYDSAMATVASAGPYGPIIAGAMAGNKMLGKVANSLGGGTDGKTTTDAILGSSFLQLTPLGLINGFGGKKANTITKDNDIFSQAGSSYTGSEHRVNNALQDSGAKYGLFSSNARKRANSRINEAKRQQNVLSGIMDTSQDRFDLANAMAAINENRKAFDLQGGYDLSAIRIGRHGMPISLLDRARQIIKALKGRSLQDPFELYLSTLPTNLRDSTNYRVRDYWEYNGRPKNFEEAKRKGMFVEQEDFDNSGKSLGKSWHGFTVAENPNTGELEFMKSSTHPTILKELDWYNSDDGAEFRSLYELVKTEPYYKYVKRKTPIKLETPLHKSGGSIIKLISETTIDLVNPIDVPEFQNGGSINVIPDGALHARKHNMDLEGITEKGIPVVSETENGKIEQQAEVEKLEIIFRKFVTEKLEKLLKKFYKEDATLKEKDDYALLAGQLLVKEILHNTQDNAGLL